MEEYMNQYINTTINDLTIKELIDPPENVDKYKSWNLKQWAHCKCSCGEYVDVPLYGIISGRIKSCGCRRARMAAKTLEENKKKNPTPTAVFVTYEGKTLNLSQWAKETGIPRTTIMNRMDRKLPLEKVFERRDEKDGQHPSTTDTSD